ncbi:MAG: VOC family protein [Gammaproteobacteria bacterium]|nr:VOC family protein [Gammaproteobacteria bacterium]
MANEKINYLEYPAANLASTKTFFSEVFGWTFTDYGPEYVAFDKSAGIDGGFYLSDNVSRSEAGACLTVFYSDDLTAIEQKIMQYGGKITKACFDFPGGRRFHFSDPNGNEFAVWSDK